MLPEQQEDSVVRTISLSAADVDALRSVLDRLLARTTNASPEGEAVDRDALVSLARSILHIRERRCSYFKRGMLGEPAWDMLLHLFATSDRGPRLPVGRLCALSGAPYSTALRWLDYLAREQLILRRPNPQDARSDFIELTDKGRSALEQYLSETIQILR